MIKALILFYSNVTVRLLAQSFHFDGVFFIFKALFGIKGQRKITNLKLCLGILEAMLEYRYIELGLLRPSNRTFSATRRTFGILLFQITIMGCSRGAHLYVFAPLASHNSYLKQWNSKWSLYCPKAARPLFTSESYMDFCTKQEAHTKARIRLSCHF